MRIHPKYFLTNIRALYQIYGLIIEDGYVYIKHQWNVWTKTGIHYITQPAHLSHGSTRLLSSALHNWTLGTQNQKKNCLCVDDFGVKHLTKDDANHLLDPLKITLQF